jgi:hypothetical protein
VGRKNPKTLSGIETKIDSRCSVKFLAGKTLKPYQGLKQCSPYRMQYFSSKLSRKNPKTLSGIETWIFSAPADSISSAGKTLKPYQGLKRARTIGFLYYRNRPEKP